MIYNPIGLTDGRYERPMTPIDEAYRQTLKTDYQSTRASLSRYVAHNPSAWNQEFETYTRIRYSWTLSAERVVLPLPCANITASAHGT